MKIILLLLCALLTLGVGGAWAATPAASAYPVAGKSYYLYAQQYNVGNRYYLYSDNGTLKRSAANVVSPTDSSLE